MSSFDLAERFDAAVCFYNSLNHARDAERELRLIFACIARHVLPGGRFSFDLMSEEEYLSSWSGDERILSEGTMYELAYSYLASTRTATCRVKTRSRTESSQCKSGSNVPAKAYRSDDYESFFASGWFLPGFRERVPSERGVRRAGCSCLPIDIGHEKRSPIEIRRPSFRINPRLKPTTQGTRIPE